MSELKGQLLAMVLTLAAFGAIAAVLIPAFKSSADSVAKNVEVDANGNVSETKANVLIVDFGA